MSDDMWRRREREQRDPAEEFGGPLFPDEDPDAAASVRRHRRAPAALRSRTTPARCRTGPTRRPARSRGWRRRRHRPTTTTTRSTCGRRSPPSRRSGATTSTRTRPRTRAAASAAIRAGRSARPERRVRPRPDRRGARRRPVRAAVAAAVGRDPDRRSAAPRARPDHDRHRPVRRRAPAAGRPQSPRRGVADRARAARPGRPGRRPCSRRRARNLPAAIAAGVVLAGAVHRRHAVAARSPSSPSSTVVLGDRRLRVLRQGHREGLPPGRRARAGGLRRRPARGLLGRRASACRSSSPSPSSPARSGSSAPPGVESGPLPNMAVTTMGVVWIGAARLVRRADPALVDRRRRRQQHRHRHAVPDRPRRRRQRHRRARSSARRRQDAAARVDQPGQDASRA